jgi:hypothetical protein
MIKSHKKVFQDHSGPIKLLRVDGLEFASFLPPSTPACVLEAHTIRDIILLTSHVPPSVPDICLLPSVNELDAS